MKKLLTTLLCFVMAISCVFGVAACAPADDKGNTGVVTPGGDQPGGTEQPGGDEQPGGNEQPGGDETPEPAPEPSEGLEFELITEDSYMAEYMAELFGQNYAPCYMFIGMGNCSDTEVVIPSEYNGLPVRGVILDGLSGSVTSLYIPDSVVGISVQDNTMTPNLPALADIRLPRNQDTIVQVAWENCAFYQDPDNWEDGALYMNDWLLATNETLPTDYTVKAGTYGISGMAFLDFYDLENVYSTRSHVQRVVLPDSVKVFGGAFGACFSLKEVVLPSSFTKIGMGAFAANSGLESITLPDSVTSIGTVAFAECTGLRQIDIPEGVTHIGEGAFAGCIKLTHIEIPQGVTNIAKQAFEVCYSLTSIVIPDSVTAIDDYAFMDCSSLSTVYYTGSEAEWEQIEIASWNDELLNAEIVFNYKGE